jgi:hypothetical protein
VDTAISYISRATTQPEDPLTNQICETMAATILTLVPPRGTQPAQQRSDDRERVMDRHVFYDEPQIQTLISSLDEFSRSLLKAAADRERSRLPLFPAHFGDVDPETEGLDGCSNLFDAGKWSCC